MFIKFEKIKTVYKRFPSGRMSTFCLLRCDLKSCHKQFKRKGSSSSKKKTHFCSPACATIHHNSTRDYSKTNRTITSEKRRCESCKKDMIVPQNKIKSNNNIFCSRECYGRHRTENQKLYGIHDYVERMSRPEVVEKRTKTLKESYASGKIAHPMLGKKHSKETKEKIGKANKGKCAGSKNPMFGGHTTETKEKMSNTRSRLIIEGKVKAYGSNKHKSGRYESSKMNMSFFYRSSWEQAYMKYIDDCDDIIRFEYESLRIAYHTKGKDNKNYKRYYIPDFLIEYSNGKKELIEIKPKQFVNSTACMLKATAARKYCSENKIDEYVILTKEALKEMGVL